MVQHVLMSYNSSSIYDMRHFFNCFSLYLFHLQSNFQNIFSDKFKSSLHVILRFPSQLLTRTSIISMTAVTFSLDALSLADKNSFEIYRKKPKKTRRRRNLVNMEWIMFVANSSSRISGGEEIQYIWTKQCGCNHILMGSMKNYVYNALSRRQLLIEKPWKSFACRLLYCDYGSSGFAIGV